MANVVHLGDTFYADKCKELLIEVYDRLSFNVSGELVESVEAYRGVYFNEGDNPSLGGGGVLSASGSGQERIEYKYIPIRTISGPAAKAFRFDAEWAALGDFDRWVLEQTIFEIKDTPKNRLHRLKKLLGIGHARLKANGFYVPCSRCGGSGSYSYCQMHGTRCFKCAGRKEVLPRVTKKWTKSVEAFDFKAHYAPAQGGAAPVDLLATGTIKGDVGQQLYMDL